MNLNYNYSHFKGREYNFKFVTWIAIQVRKISHAEKTSCYGHNILFGCEMSSIAITVTGHTTANIIRQRFISLWPTRIPFLFMFSRCCLSKFCRWAYVRTADIVFFSTYLRLSFPKQSVNACASKLQLTYTWRKTTSNLKFVPWTD
jgi:hypothetical protein